MAMARFFWLAAAAAPIGALFAMPEPQAPAPKKVDFGHDVFPIFKAHCLMCHSEKQALGGLRLDERAAILKGGAKGKLFDAGKGAESYLIQRILGKGGKPQMPMGFAPLSAKQVETLVRWIDQGGEIPEKFSGKPHWAYVPPQLPAMPRVSNEAWVRNPIDRFVLARLDQEKLKPTQSASKETLIRRVSLDLTGLPPTPAEIDAFLADKSPNAYEKVVDRLLASPHYGERMAQTWLDLARYADTDGFEADFSRTAWVWRDWVIDAYNQNKPFDRFTVEQIAGDMLPNATTAQRVATGFNRNTMQNREGGVDPHETRYFIMLDRVATTSEVWMGTTMACARCHDHKYDPITQADFFRMAAFFGNTVYTGVQPFEEPRMRVRSAEQDLLYERESSRVSVLMQQLKRVRSGAPEAIPVAWQTLKGAASSRSGAPLTAQEDGSFLAGGNAPSEEVYRVETNLAPGKMTAIQVEALPDPRLPNQGPGRAPNGNFVVTRIALEVDGRPVVLDAALASYEQKDFPAETALQGRREAGWAIGPQSGRANRAIFFLAQPVEGKRAVVTIESLGQYATHVLGRFRLSATQAPRPETDLVPADVRAAMDARPQTPAQTETVRAFFARFDPAVRPLQAELRRSRSTMAQIDANAPTAMVMEERQITGTPAFWLRHRGEFTSKERLVSAGVPEFLPGLSAGQPANRLGFAKWLVDRRNPLTARVQTNRMWEMVFGRGIVTTSEDFGTQASPPSHPELLDWLALRYMNSGWDTKAMLRLIVTSNTYRQSSAVSPALLAKDPANVLLARGPRFRVEAETIRDIALTASGLLNPKIGGPSVFPYQPDGIWDSPYSGERWTNATDNSRFRRGIYTFWKRTAPYPKFMAFDSTSREACTIRRIRTNTPLQALALMNDEGMMEASRALAGRMAREGGKDPLGYGFRLCTGRWPNAAEKDRLARLRSTLQARFAGDPKAAAEVGGSADAALTMVANALLNLDETVAKG